MVKNGAADPAVTQHVSFGSGGGIAQPTQQQLIVLRNSESTSTSKGKFPMILE